jgi:uncharacterized protein YdhG (YjbR/CyaY superfamily)
MGDPSMNKSPKNIDDYISSATEDVQDKLMEVRAAIMEAAPTAEESISYGIPYYDY